MSDKSVSQIANERREKDHEASRKVVSPNKGRTQNPNTNCGRQEQRETSVKGPNLGSNGNNPDRDVSNREKVGHLEVAAHGVTRPETTVEQFERKHEPAPVVEDGAIDNRKTAIHPTSAKKLSFLNRRCPSHAVRSRRTPCPSIGSPFSCVIVFASKPCNASSPLKTSQARHFRIGSKNKMMPVPTSFWE